MVLATPAFRIIKERYPDATIDVIASRHNKIIAKQNMYVHNVILFNNAPLKLLRAYWQVKKQVYDFYIDPKDHYSGTSNLIANTVRAKKKIWFSNKHTGNQQNYINVINLNTNNYKHFTEKLLAALSPLGIHYNGILPRPDLFTNANSEHYVQAFLQENNIHDYVLLNISSGKKGNEASRSWQKEKWQLLLQKITGDGFNVLINAINDEKIIGGELASLSNKVFVPNSRSINDAISFTKRASLVITPDTSLVHISAAFNKPLIALYSNFPENTQKFYPSNSQKEVLVATSANGVVEDIEQERVLIAYEKLKPVITTQAS
jgi:ADP-heptose:LPS heptosyltransferase